MKNLLVVAMGLFVATAFSAFAQEGAPTGEAPAKQEAPAPAKKEAPAKKASKKKAKKTEEGK